MDLKRSAKAQSRRAWRQFSSEVDKDGLGLSSRRPDDYIDSFPIAAHRLGFQFGKREWEIGIVRRGHVSHATAKSQPAGQSEHRMGGRLERTKIECDAVRFGQTAQLSRTE